jgi:hypothetical protein
MGAEPLILGLARMPFTFYTSTPTLAELLDHPSAVKTTISGVGGMDKGLVTLTASTSQLLGSAAQGTQFAMTQAQAASGTPLALDEPVWTYVLSAFNGSSNVSARVEVEIEYDATFYDLNSQ